MKTKNSNRLLLVTICTLLLAVVALVAVIIVLSGSDNKPANTPDKVRSDAGSGSHSNDPDPAGNGSDSAQNGISDNTSADANDRADNSGNDPAGNGGDAASDNGREGSGSDTGSENGGSGEAGTADNTGTDTPDTTDTSDNNGTGTGTPDDNGSASSNTDPDPDSNATVTATSLNVRKGAGTEYDKIKVNGQDFSLTSNDRVRIKDVKGDWFHIVFSAGGTEVDGYAYGPYIMPDSGSGFTMIAAPGSTVIDIQSERYKGYDNILREWWYSRNNTHTIPKAAYSNDITRKFPDYDAFYANLNATDDDKVFYLTFDCGYENGYTEKILDILKAHNAKACFFVTKSYVSEAPKIAKRMKDEGHLVGNHTVTHPVLPKKTDEQIENELIPVEELFKEKTGYDLDPYMRPPQGDFSERTLKIQQDLGYKTIFWSLAIANDWDLTKQNSIDPFGTIKAGHHSGCIALIHAVSSANTAALDDILTYLENEGYRFGTLDEL